MGRMISWRMKSDEPWMSRSSVTLNEPPTLFSIGTTPSSASPESTAAATRGMVL